MRRVSEGTHEFRGATGAAARCGIAIYQGADGSVAIVCSERADNSGVRVTQAAGDLAAEFWASLGQPAHFTWIEHSPAAGRAGDGERWDLVTFQVAGAHFGAPQWRHLSGEIVGAVLAGPGLADRATWQSIRRTGGLVL